MYMVYTAATDSYLHTTTHTNPHTQPHTQPHVTQKDTN